MKTKKIAIIAIPFLIILLLGVYLFTNYNKNSNNDNNNPNQEEQNNNNKKEFDGIKIKDANYKVTYEKKDNKIYFYKDGKEINSYTCETSVCDTEGRPYGGYVEKVYANKIVIYDGALEDSTKKSNVKIVFFDIEKGILNTYNDYYTTNTINDDYIYMAKYEDKTNALIVDYSGNIIKDFKNKIPVLSCYEGCVLDVNSYNVNENYIVTINNGKYGIEKITSDDIVLENIYEDIALNDYTKFMSYSYDANEVVDNNGKTYYEKNKYIKLKLNNKWYLYDLANKKNVIETPYEELILIDDSTIMVYDNNEIYFIDYTGNKVDDNVIKVAKLNAGFLKPTYTEKFSIRVKNNVLELKVCDGEISDYDECFKNYKNYKYDLKTKKLELIK